MVYDPGIHHRRSIRLRDYDYSRAGAYFVTICVFQRECLFGEVVDGIVVRNEAGRIVAAVWEDLVKRFPSISLDDFVVMPNHAHGILVLREDVEAVLVRPCESAPGAEPGAASSAPTVGDVVRAFKSISAISVNRALNRQGIPLWQRNYYERVIRNEQELDAMRQYIADNPSHWAEDENHPARP